MASGSAIRVAVNGYGVIGKRVADAVANYADAPQHEYPGRLSEMVDRGLVGRTPGEQRCMPEVLVCRGDTAAEL